MCGEEKPLDLFYNKKGGRLGKTPSCKLCTDVKNKKHANSPSAKKAKEVWKVKNYVRNRSYDTLTRFGIDYPTYLEEVDTRLAQQGGVCAICHKSPYKGKRGPVLDHCHESGTIRGVLCWTCNSAIGHLEDDPETLHRAIDYLSVSIN
jgi:hypothetical protein